MNIIIILASQDDVKLSSQDDVNLGERTYFTSCSLDTDYFTDAPFDESFYAGNSLGATHVSVLGNLYTITKPIRITYVQGYTYIAKLNIKGSDIDGVVHTFNIEKEEKVITNQQVVTASIDIGEQFFNCFTIPTYTTSKNGYKHISVFRNDLLSFIRENKPQWYSDDITHVDGLL